MHVLVLSALVACAGGDEVGEAPPQPLAPCADYTGLGDEGTTWSYRYPPNWAEALGENGAWSRTLAAALDGRVQVTQAGDYSGTGYARSTSGSATYSCTFKGVYLESDYLEVTRDTPEGPSSVVRSGLAYSSPVLVMPMEIEVGDQFAARYSGRDSDGDGGIVPFDYIVTYEVVDEQTVTVNAGTFDALEIAFSGGRSGDEGGVYFLDRDVGPISGEDFELVSYISGREP